MEAEEKKKSENTAPINAQSNDSAIASPKELQGPRNSLLDRKDREIKRILDKRRTSRGDEY